MWMKLLSNFEQMILCTIQLRLKCLKSHNNFILIVENAYIDIDCIILILSNYESVKCKAHKTSPI